jgi:solute carrier family 25 phosphate transporter 23/24/25/41
LLALFSSIDHNHDGKLDKQELQAAFSRAGLAVPNSKLDTFFSEVDKNNDGTISFEEWRYVITVGVAWSLSVVRSDDLRHRYDFLKIPSLTGST